MKLKININKRNEEEKIELVIPSIIRTYPEESLYMIVKPISKGKFAMLDIESGVLYEDDEYDVAYYRGVIRNQDWELCKSELNIEIS